MQRARATQAVSPLTPTQTTHISIKGEMGFRLGKPVKRGMDLAFSSLLLLLILPLIVSLCIILLVTQGRPILIRHKRVGKGGSFFHCLKFRTMVTNGNDVLLSHLEANPVARTEWEETRKLKNDPRVTPIGHILRNLSIDELPQLVNIVRGEMSLVGPRPIVDDEIGYYGSAINEYMSMRPGLTGLWQVSGRNDTSYAARVEMDSHYVNNWHIGQDIRIIMKTIPAVISSKGCY